jgi:hypothetical protein
MEIFWLLIKNKVDIKAEIQVTNSDGVASSLSPEKILTQSFEHWRLAEEYEALIKELKHSLASPGALSWANSTLSFFR